MGQLFLLTISGQDHPGLAAALTETLAMHRVNALDVGRGRRQSIAVGGVAPHAKPLVQEDPWRSISILGLDSILHLPGVSDREIVE